MSDYVLPTIGASGSFKLLTPFDSLLTDGVRYTCQGIRSLNDYLANNEDPYTDVYQKYGISDTDYEVDLQFNMHIVSLQSDVGHWLYVPAKYISSYPLVNGVSYRSYVLTASLPSFPTNKDMSFLETEIQNLCIDTLGVTPIIKFVESSRVVLVSDAKHENITASRNLVAQRRSTDRAKYMDLLYKHDQTLVKIAELESYIKRRLAI
jgi:hypothetical protein